MKKIDQRREVRFDFPSIIEYSLMPENAVKTFKGVTIDICESGLSLYLFELLKHGQEITIRTTLPVSRRTASVCWIKKIDGDMFKAGLKFV